MSTKKQRILFFLQTKGKKLKKRLKNDRQYSKYTPEKTVAMETSIIIDTSLTYENILW